MCLDSLDTKGGSGLHIEGGLVGGGPLGMEKGQSLRLLGKAQKAKSIQESKCIIREKI